MTPETRKALIALLRAAILLLGLGLIVGVGIVVIGKLIEAAGAALN